MDIFFKTIHGISTLCGIIASLLIASSIFVVCQMVFIRYILNGSTVWQTDYVTFALVGATLIGSPYVLLLKGHVNVDLLPQFLSHPQRAVLAYIASLMGLIFTSLLGYYGWELFHEAWVGGWVTETVWELPLWIPYIAMPIGIGLLALQYVADILALMTGREMPFAMEAREPFEGE
ncbi:TRAP transporter small permease [Terasakiella pusilla]|jgi:TRAP-type C4-dicarboxylate transport system permease small subunit|uniref:TRAP transporter small permease n=1 Tax=Terasakiella pusilla TaxID=64973 RepID=UPI00048B8BB0|nr:TRAP transporter small permease [Terasakiella pusilla]